MTDDFLKFLRAPRRGRLKIYLGMAAGVGKTFAMLREAKRLREEGIDVVCGFVETHNRPETLAETAGVERVPRRVIEYRGVPLEEMDLDAVLARRPDLVVVDELAHTDVPGLRHEKRYQDVEEILDAGISVVTAVNIQHLESLHDLVLRETGVDVRETVPDRFTRLADEVVVVDLAPADLQERLRQGKIYPPEKVERALARFFREENLAALRQLALREVANAVERRERVRPRVCRQEQGENGSAEAAPVDAGTVDAERVMVCMASQPGDTRRLLRQGVRLAGGPGSRWYVIYVRTARESTQRIDARSLRSLADNMALARELGADFVEVEGQDVAAALARFALEKRITHAVFGRPRASGWRDRLLGSVVLGFVRAAPRVDVLIVGDRPGATEAALTVPGAPDPVGGAP